MMLGVDGRERPSRRKAMRTRHIKSGVPSHCLAVSAALPVTQLSVKLC